MNNMGSSGPRRRFTGCQRENVRPNDLAAIADALFPSHAGGTPASGSPASLPGPATPPQNVAAPEPSGREPVPEAAAPPPEPPPIDFASAMVNMYIAMDPEELEEPPSDNVRDDASAPEAPGRAAAEASASAAAAEGPAAAAPDTPAVPPPAELPRPVLPVTADEVLQATVETPLAKVVSRDPPGAFPAQEGSPQAEAPAATPLPADFVDNLLAEPPWSAPAPAAEPEQAESAPPAPGGLYAIIPAGIDPTERRRASLAAAAHLAPAGRPAALLVLEGGRVDGLVVGGVEQVATLASMYQEGIDPAWAVRELMAQCGRLGVVALEESVEDLERLGGAVGRPIFLCAADEESAIEAYRGLKLWRRAGAGSEATLAVLDAPTPQVAAAMHQRLSRAAREFLGCDLALQELPQEAAASDGFPRVHCMFADAPLAWIWPTVLQAAGIQPEMAGAEEGRPHEAPSVPAVTESLATPNDTVIPTTLLGATAAEATPEFPVTSPVPGAGTSADSRVTPEADFPPDEDAEIMDNHADDAYGDDDGDAVMTPYNPADRSRLLALVESQAAALLPPGVGDVFQVDVDEPAAPPLAAVRDDGALVAILLVPTGDLVDTGAAEAWLAAHRSLLMRAYPAAGISRQARPTSLVFELFSPPPAAPGVRRILPVTAGGRPVIVVLP